MNTTDLPKQIKRPKLDYLDGLRGLSAMLIAFYHAQLFTGHQIFTGHEAKNVTNIFKTYKYNSLVRVFSGSGFYCFIGIQPYHSGGPK